MANKISWTQKKVKLSEVLEYEGALRDYSMSDLATMKKSLQKEGLIEPLIINTNGILINGKLRYNSMIELGWEECMATVPSRELTEKEHIELYLRMNRNIAGTNDYGMLRQHFTMDELERGGFSHMEISDIMLEPTDIEINLKPKLFGHELNFDTPEEKALAEELLSRIRDTYTAEERFEDNLISFLKKDFGNG